MRNKIRKVTLVVVLLLLPFGLHWLYVGLTAPPGQITVATGPPGGRYHDLSVRLAREIKSKTGIRVRTIDTNGSLENIRLLRSGRVDFCIYQHGTERILRDNTDGQRKGEPRDSSSVSAVANLYSEVVHVLVRRGWKFQSPQDLRGRRVALGLRESGDYAASLVLLRHFGLDIESVQATNLNYEQIKAAFLDDSLDAAFITTGLQAPILEELFATGKCNIVSIPFAEALATKHISMTPFKIPAGMFQSQPPVEPSVDIETVAIRAQFLTRSDASDGIVEQVTGLLMNEAFLKEHGLAELFIDSDSFASDKLEFPIHPGAQNVYDPQLKPLLNTDFVESTEGLRSFIVSILIASYLIYRWMRDRATKANEHRLDRYVHSLLEIERQQLGLDDSNEPSDAEIGRLQKLLDDVTLLRQEALRDFSAHELSEDRAIDCFLEMCHALSDKINAKLSRQRIDKRLSELANLMKMSRESEDS